MGITLKLAPRTLQHCAGAFCSFAIAWGSVAAESAQQLSQSVILQDGCSVVDTVEKTNRNERMSCGVAWPVVCLGEVHEDPVLERFMRENYLGLSSTVFAPDKPPCVLTRPLCDFKGFNTIAISNPSEQNCVIVVHGDDLSIVHVDQDCRTPSVRPLAQVSLRQNEVIREAAIAPDGSRMVLTTSGANQKDQAILVSSIDGGTIDLDVNVTLARTDIPGLSASACFWASKEFFFLLDGPGEIRGCRLGRTIEGEPAVEQRFQVQDQRIYLKPTCALEVLREQLLILTDAGLLGVDTLGQVTLIHSKEALLSKLGPVKEGVTQRPDPYQLVEPLDYQGVMNAAAGLIAIQRNDNRVGVYEVDTGELASSLDVPIGAQIERLICTQGHVVLQVRMIDDSLGHFLISAARKGE